MWTTQINPDGAGYKVYHGRELVAVVFSAAHARLIAQTPAMLAALVPLQIMVEAWAEENDATELVNAPEMVAARRVLAQVDGRTP